MRQKDREITDFNEIVEVMKNCDVCRLALNDDGYQAVNIALVQRNWLLGYRIASEELQGNERAEYGTELIKKLSKELTQNYGKGFDYSSLYKFVRFYKEFPEILDSVNPKSLPMLSWTHYRVLLQVEDMPFWSRH